MKKIQVILPFYIKALIFISDWFVLFAIVFSIPLILIFGLRIEMVERMNFDTIRTFIPVILLLSAGVLRTNKRIRIIENSTTIQSAVNIGEIILFESNKFREQRTLFRITIQLRNELNEHKITKHYYFLNSSIAKNKYDFNLIFNRDKPEKVVLINLLPRLARNYIMESK